MEIISNTLIMYVSTSSLTIVYAKLWNKRKAYFEWMGK